MLSIGLALTTLERLDNLVMDFLITYMPYLPNFKTLRPPHGLEEAHVVHRVGPDDFRQKRCLSVTKLDRGRPPREGFGSISHKT